MDISEGLNPEQKAAVVHGDGPLLVVAGAGTGKTQVITRRIARLIQSGDAKPSEILALTFTEKASQEMSDRLFGLIGWKSFQVDTLTFNAFGTNLLHRYSISNGRSIRGGLINNTQKTLLLKQRFSEIDLKYFGIPNNIFEFLERIVDHFDRLQNAGISPRSYRNYVDELVPDGGNVAHFDVLEQHDISALYSLYEMIKIETGTYDYYDQLNIPLEILRSHPNIAKKLSQQYKYVLVDEYQDTSPVQDHLLRTFIPPGGNIFAVGDDDQAIYGFRGADIKNIMDFAEYFRVKEPTALIQNYRSGQPILDAAYRLIRHNDPHRLEPILGINKQLIAQNGAAEVLVKRYRTPIDELNGVVGDVAEQLKSGRNSKEIAILARSNSILRTYARTMRANNIPYSMSTSVNIFEQRELIHLWYLLEWIGGRAKPEAVTHIILGPFFGWSIGQYQRVTDLAKENLCTPEDSLRLLALSNQDCEQLIAKLDEWRIWASEINISQLAYRLVFNTGLSESLLARRKGEDQVRQIFEDLSQLLNQMQDYESVALDNTLSGYLETFPTPPTIEATESTGDEEGIKLLTVHASKGLEFESVFVVGTTGRAWSERALAGIEIPESLVLTKTDLPPEHEQRRLMYVAVTRAKQLLTISAPTESINGQKQAVSPLITELYGQIHEEIIGSEKDVTIEKVLHKIHRNYPLKVSSSHYSLPFESSDGWINLGVGALDAYRRCPHEFYLQYVIGVSFPSGPQLSFGTALHGVFQFYFDEKMRGENPSFGDLNQRFTELWNDRGYESPELALKSLGKAKETLRRFYDRESQMNRNILGCEMKIKLEIPDSKLRLHGRIDVLFEDDDGVEIRDFKTGMRFDPAKVSSEAKESFQLRTYALAYEELTGKLPCTVTLDHIVTGIEGSARFTPRIITNHREKLSKLADRIRERDFAPSPVSDFHNCAAYRYYGINAVSEENE